MRQLFVLLLLQWIIFNTEAQVIRYDTIRVPAHDERNIHGAGGQFQQAETKPLQVSNRESNEEDGPLFDRKKLRFGADLGLSLGSNYTHLGIGPQVGYQFNPQLLAGAGIKYYYTRTGTSYYEIRNNLVGANIFGYLYPTRFIALFAQPELNYIHSLMTDKSNGDRKKNKGMVPSLVVGGGFRIGRSHITLNYDLVQHVNSPHPTGFYLGVSAFF